MSNSPRPPLRLVAPSARPDPSWREHITNQETLRAIGAWLDIRGYTLDAIRRDADALIVEATLPDAESPDLLRFDRDALARLSDASRNDRHREARPPIYPLFEWLRLPPAPLSS